MIVANFTTVKPELAHTRTYEDFYKFLGDRPERLGIVSKMYENMTASYLTEGLGNIMYNKENKGSKFQKINSLQFEWEIDVNFIKRIPFAAVPQGDGSNGSEITMAFRERYYELYDTFMIDDSKQMCIVIEGPIRKSDDYWEYNVRLMDSDYSATLNLDACQIGSTTRWIGNVQPELNETGFVKYQSNIERQRQFITQHRCDITASERYLAMEDKFVKIANGENDPTRKQAIFKMPGMKKLLLDNFMDARNSSLLWQKSTMDVNGKSTVSDRQGRPLIAGDGIIPQIHRFSSKYNYTGHLTVNAFNVAIQTMSEKAAEPTGNTYAFICNEIIYRDVQTTLATYLQQFKVLNSYIYSKSNDGKVQVGATYTSYEFAGNTIIFKVDRALSYEYPNKGYAILVDLTEDKTSAMPAIACFTLAGKEFIENTLTGVGIKSGPVASPVAGEKSIITGYAGVGVFNPYRSFVIIEN